MQADVEMSTDLDSPVTAAVRSGNIEVVRTVLLRGAKLSAVADPYNDFDHQFELFDPTCLRSPSPTPSPPCRIAWSESR